MKNLVENIFAYRWILGFCAILICTIFEVHGSSIGIYAEILGHPELNSVVLGHYRPIRADEWRVFTPFGFSQYFTNFSMISEIVRATATNMFVVYGQAVWNVAMIYRPAQIGYLFLDQGSGLAFYWMSRLIILFLASYEFARKIIQVDKKLSLVYAVMVAFSPFAQWWWSVNSTAEILAAGQGLVVFLKLYLERAETSRRFFYAVGFLWATGILIFGIYPAWQVSFGYVFLVAAVAILWESELKIFWADKFFWLIGIPVMLAPILHVLYLSQDMIQLQLNTIYPGQRFYSGGDGTIPLLLHYAIGSILPFKDVISDALNNCEMATFYSMMPLGFVLAYFATFKIQNHDKFIYLMAALCVFQSLFTLVGLPDILAKISLLSFTTVGRLRVAIDFAQLILIFRSLKFITEFPPRFERLLIAEIISLASAFSIYEYLTEWFFFGRAIFAIGFSTVAAFLIMSPMTKIRAGFLALMMLAIGATVNPINLGVDVIYKMPVGKKISELGGVIT